MHQVIHFCYRIQAILDVQFVGETVEEVEHFVAYKLQNFISDAGGLLGLFMGCSLISVVEIFYFIIQSIINMLFKRRKVATINIQRDQNELFSLVSAMNEEMRSGFKKLNDLEENILKFNKKFDALQQATNQRLEKLERFNNFFENI